MKTWEMIKEITEHPEKEFYDKYEPEAGKIYFDGKAIRWQDTAEPLKLILLDQGNWEEVRQLDFMTAMEEIKDEISVEYDGVVVEFKKIDEMFYFLGKHYTDTFIRSLILNGKWYIEED